MIKDLLPGFRSLKSSLLTGIMIMIMVYLLVDKMYGDIKIPESIIYLLEINDLVPTAMIAVVAALTGSLYTTLLEGVVDWIYRKNIKSMIFKKKTNKLWSRIRLSFMPFSEAAYERIKIALIKFYQENRMLEQPENQGNTMLLELSEEEFMARNLKEILWMDGKLVGTSLIDTYDQYRAEGESRLAVSLLLPELVLTICNVFETNIIFIMIVFTIVIMIAVKLADDGLYYYRRSNSFLAHHIADGEINTSTMEDIIKKYKVIVYKKEERIDVKVDK